MQRKDLSNQDQAPIYTKVFKAMLQLNKVWENNRKEASTLRIKE